MQEIKMLGSRYPLKSVLKKDEFYTITKCRIDITLIPDDIYDIYCASNIMKIDVKPSSGGETIETYFNTKLTEVLLELCDTDAQDCGVVLLGVKFVYGGEVTSEAGVIYSDVQFLQEPTCE